MKSKMKFKIGEFLKLCQVTVKTLRHYEEIGLLTPFEVDKWTGYRYYDIGQLRQMARIFATHRCKIDSYQELFNLLPNVIGPEMQRLGCQCPEPQYCFTVEYNEEYAVDIDIEYFEAVSEAVSKVASKAASETVSEAVSEATSETVSETTSKAASKAASEAVSEAIPEAIPEATSEATPEAVENPGDTSEIIKFKSLPEVPTALCINHYGSYEKMPETIAELYAYAETNSYELSDHPRLCYIDGIWNKESVYEWLTEIQLPVKR